MLKCIQENVLIKNKEYLKYYLWKSSKNIFIFMTVYFMYKRFI